MVLVPYLGPENVSEEFRNKLALHSNGPRALAHSPEGLHIVMQFAVWARSSSIGPRIRELAILAVGYTTGAPYEWVHHLITREQFGVSDDDVRALMRQIDGQPSDLDLVAATVVRAAQELTENCVLLGGTAGDLSTQFDERQLVDLLVIIGFYNQVARTFGGLGVEVEAEHLPVLADFPLRPVRGLTT